MTRIKICGIKNLEDALFAVETGADALGFVFAPSPRRITPQAARSIIHLLPAFITAVGVFVDEDPNVVADIARSCSLNALQFHGNESPEYCRRFTGRYQVIKGFRIKDRESLAELSAYQGVTLLLDTFVSGVKGGTGKTFDWSLARDAKKYGNNIILAGGLNPANVSSAIAEALPYAVDVSSGVETNAAKDRRKIKDFINEVRRYQ